MWVMNQFIEIWKFKKTENLYDNDDVYYCNLGEDNDNVDRWCALKIQLWQHRIWWLLHSYDVIVSCFLNYDDHDAIYILVICDVITLVTFRSESTLVEYTAEFLVYGNGNLMFGKLPLLSSTQSLSKMSSTRSLSKLWWHQIFVPG